MPGFERIVTTINNETIFLWNLKKRTNLIQNSESLRFICSRRLHFNDRLRTPRFLKHEIDLITVGIPPIEQFWRACERIEVFDDLNDHGIFKQGASKTATNKLFAGFKTHQICG